MLIPMHMARERKKERMKECDTKNEKYEKKRKNERESEREKHAIAIRSVHSLEQPETPRASFTPLYLTRIMWIFQGRAQWKFSGNVVVKFSAYEFFAFIGARTQARARGEGDVV